MVRRIEIGFVAGALGFLLLAARAQGADYSVVQCGWGVGLDAAWVGNSSHFRSASDCAGASPGVRSLTVANGHHAGSGAYARWRWSAPAGATITALRGSWWRSLAAGFRQRISGFDAGGRRAVLRESAASGASSALSAAPGGDFGHAIESELECRQKSCDQSPLSSAGVGRLIFTLRDSAAPVLTAGGPLASGGWLRGDQTVSFQASDQGSGVAAVDTLIDDHAQDHQDAPCRVAMVDGARHGASMRPCDAIRSGGSTIATAELTDGIHALKLCALDFSGERGCAPRIDAHIDNSAPSAPEALAVLDGDGWHSSNGFSLRWRNPAPGAGAPVRVAWYRLSAADGGEETAPVRIATAAGALDAIELPAPGAYSLSLWLEDAAGNVEETAAAAATLRFDDAPPTLAFVEERDPARPADVAATVEDGLSGVAGGEILYRRLGAEEWRPLATTLAAADGDGPARLQARIPASAEPGSYELRAEAVDGAGNRSATETRADGSPMTVRAPPQAKATPLVTLAATRRRLRNHALLVLQGRLHPVDDVQPAAAKLVEIQFRDRRRAVWQSIALLRTDSGGRFRFRHRFLRIAHPARIGFRARVPAEAGWPYSEAVSRTVTVLVRP